MGAKAAGLTAVGILNKSPGPSPLAGRCPLQRLRADSPLPGPLVPHFP